MRYLWLYCLCFLALPSHAAINDVIWRHTETGAVYFYQMQDGAVSQTRFYQQVSPDWSIIGMGDVNNDATYDLIWQHRATGQLYWHLVGANQSTVQYLDTLSANWQLAAVADFDADGNDDQLWRDQVSGDNQILLSTPNAATPFQRVMLNPVKDTQWRIAGAGDLDADGYADIVWRHMQTGQTYLYLMQGAALKAHGAFKTIPTTWTLESIGDFDADGHADLLWRNRATGLNHLSLMNGLQAKQHAKLNQIGADWILAQSVDVDQNGTTDLVWRHIQTGQNYLYLMQGYTYQVRYLNRVADPLWRVVGAPVAPTAVISGYSTTQLELGTHLQLSAAQSTDDGAIVQYRWNQDSDGATFDYHFDQLGDVTIQLSVLDDEGLSNQTQVTFNVVNTQNQPPVAVITPKLTEVTLGETIEFSAAESTDDGSIVGYQWNNDATTVTTIITFNELGEQTVSVIVTDDQGATNQADLILTVVPPINEAPVAVITPKLTEVTLGETVEFSASESTDDGSIVGYQWNNDATTVTTSITFNELGEQTVSVIVTDDQGVTNQTDLILTVIPPINEAPVAVITPKLTEVTLGETVEFSAAASMDDQGIASYLWSTGDSSVTTTITFETLGEYALQLTVTDAQGESDAVTQLIQVHPIVQQTFNIWIEADSAPTIWAWTDTQNISSDMGFEWDAQQTLQKSDQHPGYYVWQLPAEYLDAVSTATPLKFLLNSSGYPYTVSRSGCLSKQNQWDNASDGCFLPRDFVPYIGPYLTLISPELSDNQQTVQVLDPAHNMVVNYETTFVAPDWTAQAEYRALGAAQWQVADETTKGHSIHHIELKGLQADTTYQYRVKSPQGSYSKVYQFHTAKPDMDYSRFLTVGDMQDPGDENQRWQDVANAIMANHLDEFDFIITVGDMAADDMSHNGDRYYFWRVFFNKGQELFARKPIMPTPGNHDTPENVATGDPTYSSNAEDTHSYRKYFNLPIDMAYADYYHFDYGNAHFMSVNSEIPVFYGRYPQRDTQGRVEAQRKWLETELQKATDNEWNFAYWHVPAINPAGGKDEVQYLRPLTDLFYSKLDWAITGHVHENQRVKPTIATSNSLTQVADYGREAGQGVGYYICPPAGQWPRNNSSDQMDLLAYYPNHNGEVAYEIGYGIVQVQGQNFKLTTYGLGDVAGRNNADYSDNGSLRILDQIQYSKDASGLKKTVSQVDFRGTANSWNKTAMTLVEDYTWQIDVTITAADAEPTFKFFADAIWYGDSQPDGIASSNEDANIAITTGAGQYRIRLNDTNFSYSIQKL